MTLGQRILVVEDDDELRARARARPARGGLRRRRRSRPGRDVLERVEQAAPDALVIDIGLPDADGRDVCQALRARGVQTPVLFLTARDALVDRIAGFDAGGDDYLTKPFAFVELVARLQALLRRSGSERRRSRRPGSGSTRSRTRSSDAPATVPLTPTEFRLLARLLARPGEAVRRRDLVARRLAARRDRAREHARRVRRALRRKLRAPRRRAEIATVHGVGYRHR